MRRRIVSFRCRPDLYYILSDDLYYTRYSISSFIEDAVMMKYYLEFVLRDVNFGEYLRVRSSLINYNKIDYEKKT